MSFEVNEETRGFQSEVRQLLDLVVHSLYGNSEIFLRELVSNAADALDKLRFLALADDTLYEGDQELGIRVQYSQAGGTITVTDNGIGMSREEVVDNLGTIARSGTREFFNALTGDARQDAQLIGQFGVGFYSAFIVAERVTVLTRRAGAGEDDGVSWESDGQGEYTIHNVKRRRRGTEVVLHLREQAREYLDGARLRGIVHRYSEHIPFPIRMPREGEGESGEEVVNAATALWARPRSEITDEDYREFYRHVSHDFDQPLAWVHSRVEGALEYTSLFYLPRHAPFDLWDANERRGVKLYVRRVFIMDAAEQLLPRYLRFVRGVVDSDDLPLNVSREILQENKQLASIRAGSVKKILGLLEDLTGDRPDDYALLWKNFGRVLKEGVVEDAANRERIARLLRFSTSREDRRDNDVTLAAYVQGMKEGQRAIYYLTGEDFDAVRTSPHLEAFRARGIEVLLLSDPVDEWLVAHLGEFDGKPLKSVARGVLDAGELGAAPAGSEAPVDDAAGAALAARLRAALGESVKEVRVTHRLISSPACLVVDDGDPGAGFERMLRAAGREVPRTLPILEINPAHPLVARLADEADERLGEWARILLDQALLSEGGRLEDSAGFVRRLNGMLLQLLG
ncbi:MAG: molecular chaperone HtpG [Gammaproteobacteria bacterium]|nr:molecular chaperone HtpG [Gammaproteobacteria bacterium]